MNVIEPLKQHYRQMNQQNNNNQLARQISRSDEVCINFELPIERTISLCQVWESVKFIVPAIQKIRQKSPGATADDAIYSV